MNLTAHFTREEFEFSQKAIRLGIDNAVPFVLNANAQRMLEYMELIRSKLRDHPIIISSGYRCAELNALTSGSSVSSAHRQALACDFTCPSFGTVFDTAEFLAATLRGFDQLIYEGTWIHVGLAESFDRGELLTATFVNGEPHYVRGIVK